MVSRAGPAGEAKWVARGVLHLVVRREFERGAFQEWHGRCTPLSRGSSMPPTQKPYVILAAVDFSAASDLALERALELATEKPAVALHVVNVLPVYQVAAPAPGDETAGAFIGSLPSTTDAAEQLRKYTEARVEAFRASHPYANLGFLDRVVAHQRLDVPSEEIANLAGELEADLVVVGTHGRRGLSRLLLGSVAEGTVRLAPCPVLVVRPKMIPAAGPQI